MAIINNVAYSWSMIRISIPALDISEDSTIMQGVSEIKWNKTRKVENNYGIGGNAINRGFGNKTCTASITMDYNTVSQALDYFNTGRRFPTPSIGWFFNGFGRI